MFKCFASKKGYKSLISQKITDFFYSPLFYGCVAIMALLSYVTASPFVSLAIIGALACLIFLRSSDATPVIPLFFFALIQIRHIEDMAKTPAIIIFCIVAVFLILHFILYPPKKFLKLKLTIPLILISIAYFLGGIGCLLTTDYKRNFLLSLANGPLLLFIYFFFANYIDPPKNVDLKNYFFEILVVVGITISAQILIHNLYFFKYLNDEYPVAADIGIGNVNNVAAVLIFSTFACFYLIAKMKNFLCCFIALAIMYVALAYSLCYGAIGATLILTPVAAYYTARYQTTKNKKILNLIYFSVVLLIAFALTYIFAKYGFINCITTFGEKISDDHGRTPLFIDAINLFVKHPIFGVSVAYIPQDKTPSLYVFGYNFHSTIFHTLATLGIFGFTAYSTYYVARYKMILKFFDSFNVFSYIAFGAFFAYSVMDTNENTVIPCVVFAILFMNIIEYVNNTREPKLPLNNKVKFTKL